jgi:hypothetical protein
MQWTGIYVAGASVCLPGEESAEHAIAAGLYSRDQCARDQQRRAA